MMQLSPCHTSSVVRLQAGHKPPVLIQQQHRPSHFGSTNCNSSRSTVLTPSLGICISHSHGRGSVLSRAQAPEQQQADLESSPAAPAAAAAASASGQGVLAGEDAAVFDWSQQSLRSWALFGVLLSTVLAAMYVVSEWGSGRGHTKKAALCVFC